MILYTIYLDLGAKLNPASVYFGPLALPAAYRKARRRTTIAKQKGHRKVMGVLDPVPWRWDEHPLVDQGFGTGGL